MTKQNPDGRYRVYSYDTWQRVADNPPLAAVLAAGAYDRVSDSVAHTETVTYKMIVVDSQTGDIIHNNNGFPNLSRMLLPFHERMRRAKAAMVNYAMLVGHNPSVILDPASGHIEHFELTLVDLLADLMLISLEMDVAFGQMANIAKRHYVAEK